MGKERGEGKGERGRRWPISRPITPTVQYRAEERRDVCVCVVSIILVISFLAIDSNRHPRTSAFCTWPTFTAALRSRIPIAARPHSFADSASSSSGYLV